MTPYLLILAVLLGIAPGLIAHGKGRNFLIWWVYGVFLGPVALLHAILLRQKPSPYFAAPSFAASPYDPPAHPQRSRWRSRWPIALWGAASVAIAIIAVTGYGLMNPAQFGFQNQEPEVSVSADRTPPNRTTAVSQTPDGNGQSTIADAPAAERPLQRGGTPTVRVTVRHESLAPPPEQVASAPSIPVERGLPAETAATESHSLERTKPIEAETAEQVAAKTAPIRKTVPRSATPPAPPEAAQTASTPAPAPSIPAPTAPKPSAAPAAKPAPPPVTAVGETVQIVQLALAKKGYDPGPANGRAGTQTQTAVRKFQSDSGMQPTGAIDYALLEKLGIVGPRVHAFRPPPGATPGR